jgi:hypothetical protein
VASTPRFFPLSKPSAANRFSTHRNTAWCVPRFIIRRVLDSVEWSGVCSSSSLRESSPRAGQNGILKAVQGV